ncbi:hypothetical protein P9112_007769 [Eukaryota sp. TZLM1-RC]
MSAPPLKRTASVDDSYITQLEMEVERLHTKLQSSDGVLKSTIDLHMKEKTLFTNKISDLEALLSKYQQQFSSCDEGLKSQFDSMSRLRSSTELHINELKDQQDDTVATLKSEISCLEESSSELARELEHEKLVTQGLRRQVDEWVAKHGEVNRKLREMEAQREVLEEEVKISRDVVQKQAEVKEIQEEVSSLKSQLEAQIKRCDELSDTNNDLKQQLTNVSKERNLLKLSVDDLSKQLKTVDFREVVDSQSQHDSLKTKACNLQSENERLLGEINRLKSLVNQSPLDYDPSKTKVLTFKENPMKLELAKKSNQMEQLRAENYSIKNEVQVLKDEKRILMEELESLKGQQGSNQQLSRDISDLQSKLSSSETKYDRLKTIFHQHVHHFREAITTLTGWQIELDGNYFKLKNLYSEAKDYLAFENPEPGVYLLVETKGLEQINSELVDFLTKVKSIPAFLAQIILEQFNQQTLAV